jgi:hypothetical protein
MASFESLQQLKAELIRKPISGADVFVAPMTSSLPTSLTTGGVQEVQTVAVTGSPTSGTFTLTLGAYTTTAIQYNAAASAVATAVAALPNVGTGNVTGSGGPLPGSTVTLTFSSSLGDVATMTKTSSLGGGTAPDVTVTATTQGTPIDLAPLPSGYVDLGYLSRDDAPTWSRETELSELTAIGATESVRADITSDVSSLSVTALETKRKTLELYDNVDLSAVTPTAVTGEIAYNRPTRPRTSFNRIFVISMDDSDSAGPIYIARLCPRAQVTEVGEQVWSDGDDAMVFPLTFSAKKDATAGYAMRCLFGGPGWKAHLEDAGFPAAA